MSYGQPGVSGFAPVAGPPPVPGRPAALTGLGVVLVVDLVLELALLMFDLNRKGVGYLQTAIWNDFHNAVTDAPIGFWAPDTATVIALVVLICGAFSGKGWVRPAGAVLLVVNGYSTAISLVNELTSSQGRSSFASPAVPNLWLNLDAIAQVVLALAFGLTVAATMSAGPRPSFGGSYAPMPPAPMPGAPVPPAPVAPGYAQPVPPQDGRGGAPGFPPPPAQPPMQPPGQPGQSPYGGYPPNR